MKCKKYSIILTGAIALIISMNLNVTLPIFSARTELNQIDTTRTIDCTKHEWKYKTIIAGNDIFYNYECKLCGFFRYEEWIKK